MQSFVLFKIPGYLVELDRISLCLVGGVFSDSFADSTVNSSL
jgi:hypothetical protein